MLDTLAVAQQLTDGGVERRQAEVIATAIRVGSEQGDHVTSDCFKAGLAELRTEIAESRAEQRTEVSAVRTEIADVRTEIANLKPGSFAGMVGTVLATGALTVAILRLVG